MQFSRWPQQQSSQFIIFIVRMGTSHSKHKQYYEMRGRVHGYRRQNARSKSVNEQNFINAKANNLDYLDTYRSNKKAAVVYEPNFMFGHSAEKINQAVSRKTKQETESTLPQPHCQHSQPKSTEATHRLISLPWVNQSLQQIHPSSRQGPPHSKNNQLSESSRKEAYQIASLSPSNFTHKMHRSETNTRGQNLYSNMFSRKVQVEPGGHQKEYKKLQMGVRIQSPELQPKAHRQKIGSEGGLRRSKSIYANEHGSFY